MIYKKTQLISKLLIFILLISLTSCGVFQKIFKSSSKTKDNIEIKVNKEEIFSSIDSSKITTTEIADSNLVIKGKNYNLNNNLKDLNDIKNLLLINNDLVSISQTYDSIGKALKTIVILKDQTHNIKINKTTVKQNNIKIDSKLKLDSNFKEEKKVKNNVKQKEPINVLLYILIFVGICGIAYITFKWIYPKIKAKFLI